LLSGIKKKKDSAEKGKKKEYLFSNVSAANGPGGTSKRDFYREKKKNQNRCRGMGVRLQT